MARVSTYLNFPRSTETAFLFYRSVFQTEFQGPIARFAEMPPDPNQPPVADADKDLHVELPILGGHVLMGTDAPESMGFTVTPGNNVYIMLEPDTRSETDRLFEAAKLDRADGTAKLGFPLQRDPSPAYASRGSKTLSWGCS